jgi:hypothetical protein
MTIDLSLRDVVAIWGAGLSTILLLLKVLPSRPRFHVEPGERQVCDLTIRIANPAKGMCFVRECWRIRAPRSERSLGVFTDKTIADAGKTGSLWITIRSESEVTVKVNCLLNRDGGPKCRWLVIFGWQGSWIVPLWVPVPVYVSTGRANRLNTAR